MTTAYQLTSYDAKNAAIMVGAWRYCRDTPMIIESIRVNKMDSLGRPIMEEIRRLQAIDDNAEKKLNGGE